VRYGVSRQLGPACPRRQFELRASTARKLQARRADCDDWPVDEPLPETVLVDIEQRLDGALSVAPAPWSAGLETREGTGGESFVQFLGDPDVDNEMYLSVHLGSERLVSPDPRLDMIVDFVGNAPQDVRRLLVEVGRLRDELSRLANEG
jgi:hypothetical protein